MRWVLRGIGAVALSACASAAPPPAAGHGPVAHSASNGSTLPTNGSPDPAPVVASEPVAVAMTTGGAEAPPSNGGSDQGAPHPEVPFGYEPQAAEPPSPKEMARATKLMERGRNAYMRGDYDRAAGFLREAIAIYPFMPEANLALGKIFLIKGSAARDLAMINSARLMFEMARAIDPSLPEPQILLELFQASPE